MFFRNPLDLLLGVPAILLAITFHEYAHGKMAAILGDPTPGAQGRLTLNPLAHLDVMGALMFVLVGFGWAKPVQFNPFHLRGNRRTGLMLVALAGPVMNLVLAYLASVLERLVGMQSLYLAFFLDYVIRFNVILAIFNLIPLPPLDGSRVLGVLLPPKEAAAFFSLESYGPLILILLLVTGIIGRILGPMVVQVERAIHLLSGLGPVF